MGASTWSLLGMAFGQGLRQLLIGLGVGVVASLGLTQALESMLVGVKPVDPITLITVALVLTGAGVLGSAIPARRAVKIDPIIALRYQ
ncbi:MAG: ABC transporter permease, partial [Acidobacteriia bacterium]|nr:ABC transporter permease [Terriglobia bacterium]